MTLEFEGQHLEYTFTGRVPQLDDAARAWASGKQIFGIYGFKGVGKTRFAKELVRRHSNIVKNVHLLDLRGVETKSELILRVVTCIRLVEPVTESNWVHGVTQCVRNWIVNGTYVLLVDNVEAIDELPEVRKSFFSLCTELIKASPDIKIILTSCVRFRFGAAKKGYQGVDVPVLTDEESKQLLREVIGDDLELGEHENKIVELCSGIPLAIQIAGCELTEDEKQLSPRDLVKLLEKSRINPLSREHYSEEEQMGNVIGGSISRLSDVFQQYYASMNFIPGTFSQEAAASVLGFDDTADMMDKAGLYLYRRSLVTYDRNTQRYDIHPMQREFLVDNINVRDLLGVRSRYGKFFTDCLVELQKVMDSKDGGKALVPLNLELTNFKKLLEVAAYSQQDGTYDVFIKAAMEATFLILYYLPDQSISFYRVMLDTCMEHGTDYEAGSLMSIFGEILSEQQGDYLQALDWYDKAEKKLLPSGNSRRLAEIYQHLGWYYYVHGPSEKSIENHLKSYHMLLDLGLDDDLQIARVLNCLGITYTAAGNAKEAEKYHLKSLDIRIRHLGDEHLTVAMHYNNVGLMYNLMESYDKAIEYFEKSYRLKKQLIGPSKTVIISMRNIGLQYIRKGEYLKALELAEENMKTFEKVTNKDPNTKVNILEIQSIANVELGRYEEAVPLLEEMYEVKKKATPGHSYNKKILMYLGKALRGCGRLDEARGVLLEAYNMKMVEDDRFGIVNFDILKELGHLFQDLGDRDLAMKYFHEAIEERHMVSEYYLEKDYPERAKDAIEKMKELILSLRERSEPIHLTCPEFCNTVEKCGLYIFRQEWQNEHIAAGVSSDDVGDENWEVCTSNTVPLYVRRKMNKPVEDTWPSISKTNTQEIQTKEPGNHVPGLCHDLAKTSESSESTGQTNVSSQAGQGAASRSTLHLDTRQIASSRATSGSTRGQAREHPPNHSVQSNQTAASFPDVAQDISHSRTIPKQYMSSNDRTGVLDNSRPEPDANTSSTNLMSTGEFSRISSVTSSEGSLPPLVMQHELQGADSQTPRSVSSSSGGDSVRYPPRNMSELPGSETGSKLPEVRRMARNDSETESLESSMNSISTAELSRYFSTSLDSQSSEPQTPAAQQSRRHDGSPNSIQSSPHGQTSQAGQMYFRPQVPTPAPIECVSNSPSMATYQSMVANNIDSWVIRQHSGSLSSPEQCSLSGCEGLPCFSPNFPNVGVTRASLQQSSPSTGVMHEQDIIGQRQSLYVERQLQFEQRDSASEWRESTAEQRQFVSEHTELGRSTEQATEPKEIYTEYAEQRQSIMDQRQSTTDQRQATTDQRQSTTDQRQSTTDQRQSTTDQRRSTTDQRQAITDQRQSTTDQRQAITDQRQSTTDQRQATTDQRQSTTDQRQSTTDQRQAITDQRQSTTDQRQSTTDQRRATSDQRQSTTDQRQSSEMREPSTGQISSNAVPIPTHRVAQRNTENASPISPFSVTQEDSMMNPACILTDQHFRGEDVRRPQRALEIVGYFSSLPLDPESSHTPVSGSSLGHHSSSRSSVPGGQNITHNGQSSPALGGLGRGSGRQSVPTQSMTEPSSISSGISGLPCTIDDQYSFSGIRSPAGQVNVAQNQMFGAGARNVPCSDGDHDPISIAQQSMTPCLGSFDSSMNYIGVGSQPSGMGGQHFGMGGSPGVMGGSPSGTDGNSGQSGGFSVQLTGIGGMGMPSSGIGGQPSGICGQPSGMGRQIGQHPSGLGGQPSGMCEQPNWICGQPVGICGQPSGMYRQPLGMSGLQSGSDREQNRLWGQPGVMGGQPTGMGGQLAGMGGQPTGMGGQPTWMGGQLAGMGGQPTGMGGQLAGMGGRPTRMGGQLAGMGVQPSGMVGQPTGMGGQPSGMGGQPSGMGGQPSGMGGHQSGISIDGALQYPPASSWHHPAGWSLSSVGSAPPESQTLEQLMSSHCVISMDLGLD